MIQRLVVVAALLTTSMVLADVPPPDTQGCLGKKSGDACKNDNGGTSACAESNCSRLAMLADGGRETQNFACLLCNGKSGGGCAAVPGPMVVAALALLGLMRRRGR